MAITISRCGRNNRPVMSCVCSAYAAPLLTFADLQERCRVSAGLMPHLELVAQDDSSWRSVYRCRECGSLWAREYPSSETHGGGPPCFYAISTDNARQWLMESEAVTTKIRREEEDRRLYECLGPESGPELCQRQGCKHKRVAHSIMCREHHFEMITGRKYAVRSRE